MFNRPNIFEAYKDFVLESKLLGYPNLFIDKFYFLSMYLEGDYNYLLDDK